MGDHLDTAVGLMGYEDPADFDQGIQRGGVYQKSPSVWPSEPGLWGC